MVSEHRLKKAFLEIKKDITTLQAEVVRLSKENELLTKIVKEHTNRVVQTETKVIHAKAVNHYVASKNGGKFHKVNCPYAKNIKPKDRLSFKSKNAFLNKGYKPCKCVN